MQEKAPAVPTPVTQLPQETMRDRVTELELCAESARRDEPDPTARQRAKGKLTVRDRLDALLDPGSFQEVELFRRHRATGFGLDARRPHTDGVVAGWGKVFGRDIMVYAHD